MIISSSLYAEHTDNAFTIQHNGHFPHYFYVLDREFLTHCITDPIVTYTFHIVIVGTANSCHVQHSNFVIRLAYKNLIFVVTGYTLCLASEITGLLKDIHAHVEDL